MDAKGQNMPKDWMGGYTWKSRKRIRPCLLCACYYSLEHPFPPGIQKYVNPLWVLDYSRITVGRTRVGSNRSPWLDRGPNIAHLYPPKTPYWEQTHAVREPRCGAYIVFAGGTEAGLRDLIPSHQSYARFLDPEGKIEPLLHQAALIGSARGEAGFDSAQAVLWEIFQWLRSSTYQARETYLITEPDRSAAPASGLQARVEAYFRTHLAEKITLAQLASALHISPSLLSHRYTEQTGRSPMLALIDLRIQLAKTLLLHGPKLSDIAARTGFYDAYHLSKTFKKHTGLSPNAFLRSLTPRFPRKG
jgi:AraC-like DNA-binding protein